MIRYRLPAPYQERERHLVVGARTPEGCRFHYAARGPYTANWTVELDPVNCREVRAAGFIHGDEPADTGWNVRVRRDSIVPTPPR